jgi:hypothetical protein
MLSIPPVLTSPFLYPNHEEQTDAHLSTFVFVFAGSTLVQQ